MDSPLITLLLFAGAVYLFKLWLQDTRSWQAGTPNEKAFPGATSAPPSALWIAAIGALFLVAVETAGEIALGVSSEQTNIAAFFLFAMVGAGVLEEILFRGYLVITGKGRTLLLLSIIGFSLLFAIAHYQYYTQIPEDGTWRDIQLHFTPKASWSLLLLFLNSLWFYAVRFYKWNPHHSLLPCFVAHIASNIGVFVVKAVQGHVTSLW